MLAERFDERELSFGMLVFTSLPRSLPILGDAGCSAFDARLSGAGVSLRTQTVATEVRAGEVLTDDGRIPFDLSVRRARLIVSPGVVQESGLPGPKGWIPVDAGTLRNALRGRLRGR